MSLERINRAIHRVHPEVTLYRGEGYHYFEFDNGIYEDGTKMNPTGFTIGNALVFETDSVMVPYTNSRLPGSWVIDGVEFGNRIKKEKGL